MPPIRGRGWSSINSPSPGSGVTFSQLLFLLGLDKVSKAVKCSHLPLSLRSQSQGQPTAQHRLDANTSRGHF